MDPKLRKFINEFNSKDFFEAHETLEELWNETEGDLRKPIQALIQIAAALHLITLSRCDGAITVLKRARVNLQDFPSKFFDIDISALLTESEDFLKEASTLKTTQELAFPSINV